MSNPRAKRCVGCGLWLSIRTQVCYICGADQTAPHQAKVPVSGTMDPAKETARRLLVTDVDPAGSMPKELPKLKHQIQSAPVGRVFLYRLFDADGHLLYVGITWNPRDRWRAHKRTKEWWGSVTHYDLHLCENERDARAWETWCIRNLNPEHNRQQNRKWHSNGSHTVDQT